MSFMKEIDDRTTLAGANRLELLLFSIGTPEVFGINVFKVREVLRMPTIVQMPDTDPRIEGLATIRETMVPVIALAHAIVAPPIDRTAGYLIVSEHNTSVHGLHVNTVDRIVRISWEDIKTPPMLLHDQTKGVVTAVTTLPSGQIVLVLDVEKVLAEIWPAPTNAIDQDVPQAASPQSLTVLFADDSSVARRQIARTLDRMGIAHYQADTGAAAWTKLQALADQAAAQGQTIHDLLHLILTDIEMPEMDGFTLVKQIRQDTRFATIPVVMHSSLTSTGNHGRAKALGATDYLTKFHPKELAALVLKYAVRPPTVQPRTSPPPMHATLSATALA